MVFCAVDCITRVKKILSNICAYRTEATVILLSAHRVTHSVKTLKHYYVIQNVL